MYHNEHMPPHFHIRYGSQKAAMAIDDLHITEGKINPRVRGLVTEWAASHQQELMDNWKRAMAMDALQSIRPLE